MFEISGKAIFYEDSMHLGEEFCENEKNSGLEVRKTYLFNPPRLYVEFGVCVRDKFRPGVEFAM